MPKKRGSAAPAAVDDHNVRPRGKVLARPALEPPSAPTFRQLAEEVMNLRDEQGIRGIGREKSRYRCHVATAAFADKPISEIGSPDIREWLRWMQQRDARVRDGAPPKKLDKATISRCQSLVSAVFVEAVEREVIATNPCLGVKPKRRVDESDTEEEWAYLTWEEQQRLWACEAITIADRLAMRVAVGTGMRQGEQLNLELPDLVVDGADPHVHIRHSWPQKGRPAPPKSGKRRKVPLMGDALAAAREWLAMLSSFAISNPLNLVFPTKRGCRRQPGKPLGRGVSAMRHVYARASIPYRPGLHWHALRHTFGTNLVSGVLGRAWRLEEIQVLMGHSSITITQRYAHLGEDAIKQAVREANAAAVVAKIEPAPLLARRWSPWLALARFIAAVQAWRRRTPAVQAWRRRTPVRGPGHDTKGLRK